MPFSSGVISKDLQLSDQPVLGDWKIEVKVMVRDCYGLLN